MATESRPLDRIPRRIRRRPGADQMRCVRACPDIISLVRWVSLIALLMISAVLSGCATRTPAAAGPIDRTYHSRAAEWMTDQNGCRIWDAYPASNERATWSGACVNGLAHGLGAVQWLANGHATERYDGELRDGNYNGRGIRTKATARATTANFTTQIERAWRFGTCQRL
jgi:hypothetical protein